MSGSSDAATSGPRVVAEVLLSSTAIALLHLVIGVSLTLLLAWSWSDLPSGFAVVAIVDLVIVALAVGGSLVVHLDPELDPDSARGGLAAVLGVYIGEGVLGQARAVWIAILARLPLALAHLLVEAFAPLWVALDPGARKLLRALARLRGVVPSRLVGELSGVRSPLAMAAALAVARRTGAVRVFEGSGARRVGPGPEIERYALALGVERVAQR